MFDNLEPYEIVPFPYYHDLNTARLFLGFYIIYIVTAYLLWKAFEII